MKQLAALFLLGGILINSNGYSQMRIPTLELHGSANRPLSADLEDQTFFGGGFGANLVFRDAHLLSFKTGIETNFFHTWDKTGPGGKGHYTENVHYNYWNLSIPLMFRLNVGQKVKFFMEAGGYWGIPLSGEYTSRYTSFYGPSPSTTTNTTTRTELYEGFYSLTAAASIGGIFPVSRRVDLMVKPEFAFYKNTNPESFDVGDFNNWFLYIRLCLGVRINFNKEIE